MDSSDCESDLGASPSVTSDSSEDSSSCESTTSPSALKIITPQQQSTARKICQNQTVASCSSSASVTPTTTPAASSASTTLCSTPSSAKRKPVKKRYLNMPLPVTPPSPVPTSPSQSSKSNQIEKLAPSDAPTPTTPPSKRKRPSTKFDLSLTPEKFTENGEDSSKLSSPEKRKRNKRRRTRSERNLLAGKTVVPLKPPVEGEEAFALCAKIDQVLEEKRVKNNLSATNVKSIIHHVITNNWVQKMVMSAVKRKAASGSGGGGGSSDDDLLLEPKMTRAKTKELWESSKLREVWPMPMVDSPGKKSKQMSETHILIHNELPEDSSGDEEYVPVEGEADATHTDDESGSVTSSHASDVGSPALTPKSRISTRSSVLADKSPFNDAMFKTPPPRPTKALKLNAVNSGVSLRTRSKLPLNDTPLEDLERQLVPPDITEDMYEWGTETDNEDYLDFLKDFLNPGRNDDANEIDDDADPEYNVMEDDEDLHDKEELRRDRAVKVPKKELTQLIAELFEPGGILSGEDLDDDLATLTGITPLVNDSPFPGALEKLGESSANTTAQTDFQNSTLDTSVLNMDTVDGTQQTPPLGQIVSQSDNSLLGSVGVNEGDLGNNSVMKIEVTPVFQAQIPPDMKHAPELPNSHNGHGPPYFRDCDLAFLQHQIRQHVQLLTQAFVLTATSEDNPMKQIARSTRAMVIEMKNFAGRMQSSYFSVCNLESAWSVVNLWPHKYTSQSPIKKKILEATYISEMGKNKNDDGKPKVGYFPRPVVKVMAENTAFIYNDLLPECFDQSQTSCRSSFTYHEDALLLCAIEDTKHLEKFSTNQLAVCISEVFFGVHPPIQIYHRVRNLRKPSNKTVHPDVRRYFTDGILPFVDRSVPYIPDQDIAPLLQRDRLGLSSQWRKLLSFIEDSPSCSWEEKVSKDPVTSSIGRRFTQKRRKKKDKGASSGSGSDTGTSSSFPHSQTITKVFPQGALAVDSTCTDPSLASIPIMGANGVVGAIIRVPKLALVAPSVQQPREAMEAIGTAARPSTSRNIIETPCTTQEGEKRSDGSSPRKINMITLDHLTRRAVKTPVKKKQFSTIDDSALTEGRPVFKKPYPVPSPCKEPELIVPDIITEDVKPQIERAVQNVTPVQQVYSVIQVVGQPFYLPELTASQSSQIINVASLQTPIKNKIFNQMAEQQQADNDYLENAPERNARMTDDNSELEAPDSPNVIEEGTEVELTEDDDGDGEVDLQCHENPECITLSSDDENTNVVNSVNSEGGGNTSSSNKVDSAGSSNDKPTNSAPDTSTQQSGSSSSSKKPTRIGGCGKGEDSDEDAEKKFNSRKRPLPKDLSGDDEPGKEKQPRNDPPVMGAPPPPSVPTSSQPSSAANVQQQQQQNPGPSVQSMPTSSCSSTKYQKKARRSPGGPTGSKNKGLASKHNVTPPEKLIEESTNEFDDVADAYMESYLARVMSATEASNPGIYTSFVQILTEAGESGTLNQADLHCKVKSLLKDYPDLLREFESFLDPSVESPVTDSSTSNDLVMAEISIIQLVDKYTENCPALKAKIMSKLKTLKEKADLSEKDLAAALEPLFAGNPVMMEAFKAILPSVYRPQSVSSSMDFEVLELELDGDDPSGNTSSEDMHFETVKLPEEKNIPATSTCPCVCHVKTSDPNFQLRNKHCRKCSIKFQDGRIYYHNGRGMRPVSVELHPLPTPIPATKNISQPAVTPPLRTNIPSTTANPTHPDPSARTRKDSAPTQQVKTKECNSKKDTTEKRVNPGIMSPPNPIPSTSTTTVAVKPIPPTLRSADESSTCTSKEALTESRVNKHPTLEQPKDEIPDAGDEDEDDDWTEEEDKTILMICQQMGISGAASETRMVASIPHRSLEQLKNRRDELIQLIRSVSPEEIEHFGTT